MIYVVRSGEFKSIGIDSCDRQWAMRFLMVGDWLGLDAISTGFHNSGIIALEEGEVLQFPFVDAVELICAKPQLHRLFLQIMSRALYSQGTTIYAGDSLEWRFARFLHELGGRYGALGRSNTSFRLSMSRSDIGSFLGATVESVSRVISRLNASGVVAITGCNVEVLSSVKLAALVKGEKQAQRKTAIH